MKVLQMLSNLRSDPFFILILSVMAFFQIKNGISDVDVIEEEHACLTSLLDSYIVAKIDNHQWIEDRESLWSKISEIFCQLPNINRQLDYCTKCAVGTPVSSVIVRKGGNGSKGVPVIDVESLT